MASSSRCQIAGGSLRYNPLVCELSRQALPCRCRADGRASTRWRPGLEGGHVAVRRAPRATSSSLRLQVVGRGAWPPLCVGCVCSVFVIGIAGLAERDAMPWPARGWVCVSLVMFRGAQVAGHGDMHAASMCSWVGAVRRIGVACACAATQHHATHGHTQSVVKRCCRMLIGRTCDRTFLQQYKL